MTMSYEAGPPFQWSMALGHHTSLIYPCYLQIQPTDTRSIDD